MFSPPMTGANRTLQLLQHVREREARLLELERRFSSDAAHELRTPLAGLRARIEVALADPDGSDPWQTLREALVDADRLQAIVDDLLLLDRLDRGEPRSEERVDLPDLVRSALNGSVMRVPVSTAIRPGTVMGDHPLLVRLLSNLISNAQRHAETRVTIVVQVRNGQAVVEVRDDGTGIPPEDRERVFARFARLDPARSRDSGGTGLGLSIARQIAIAHRGSLSLEEPPGGRGARMVLRLPLAAEEPEISH
ncbi:sensor histidine kinase [Thermostaphylospora chromogena]|uniref:histidine kinase n=1 Tax=Thermostaphylospora chromogena TaxID=35622 RepID=A0A1H1C384_9ACTN|nr:ATP-binding protein [Thermostaphylospora chromogena]SDQ58621.1 Signal transduction histidine kinase [Thermostaphylospora chromogena]